MRSADPISISILLFFMEYHLKYRVSLVMSGTRFFLHLSRRHTCTCRDILYLAAQVPVYRAALSGSVVPREQEGYWYFSPLILPCKGRSIPLLLDRGHIIFAAWAG